MEFGWQFAAACNSTDSIRSCPANSSHNARGKLDSFAIKNCFAHSNHMWDSLRLIFCIDWIKFSDAAFPLSHADKLVLSELVSQPMLLLIHLLELARHPQFRFQTRTRHTVLRQYVAHYETSRVRSEEQHVGIKSLSATLLALKICRHRAFPVQPPLWQPMALTFLYLRLFLLYIQSSLLEF